jgi:phage terminase large subunit
MEVILNTTITFENLMNSTSRVTQHIGGTRSGKTYAILQYLIVEGLKTKKDITIVRKTVPSLKRTVMKDFKDILTDIGIYVESDFNTSDRIYKFNNGTNFLFLNTDDSEKLRGVKSDILFIDESSEVDEESYFQLAIRTTGQIILAFNPTISPYHWLRQMQDCQRFTTTFRDNPYLPKEMVKAIEDLQFTNEKKWLIYGKGEYAPNDKAIYQFEIVDNIEGDFVAVGLDWGFSQDPTAVVSVFRNGDSIYLDELVYDKGMVMNDIIKRLKDEGIEREEIWCDSSEPRSVEELYRAGFNAKPVKKGPDSIKFGISVMQNYQIKVTKRSQNLINEIYSYQYSTDKHGYVTDIPEDGLDHLLDACRYVAMMRLSIKQQNKGKYTLSIR